MSNRRMSPAKAAFAEIKLAAINTVIRMTKVYDFEAQTRLFRLAAQTNPKAFGVLRGKLRLE